MITTAWEAAGLTQSHWLKHSLDIRLRLAAQPYMDGGWSYSLSSPKILWAPPAGMRIDKLVYGAGSKVTNCSTLTCSLITSVRPDVGWTVEDYGDLQVYADRLPDRPDSPIQAVVQQGIAERVDGPVARRWCLVQGVRELTVENGALASFSGHAFMVRRDGTTLTVIEATSRKDADGLPIGPRYRQTTREDLVQEYKYALYWALL